MEHPALILYIQHSISPPGIQETDCLTAPVKRKAGSDGYSLPEPKLKRCRKKKGQNSSEKEVKREPDVDSIDDSVELTRGMIAHPNVVAELKSMSKALARKERANLDVQGCDRVLFLKFGLKLKAYLRMPGPGRWACPVSFCTQNYTRKSHMKTHVIHTNEEEHQISAVVFSRTFCHYCGDEALDVLFKKMLQDPELLDPGQLQRLIERLQDLKQSRSNLTDKPEVVQRREHSQAPTPAVGSKIQDDYEKDTTFQEEQGKLTPKSRQQEHISKIVEHLPKSTRSDTEEDPRSGDETDTSDSADLLGKGGDHRRQRCSISVSSPSLPSSNQDHGRSFSSSVASEGDSITGDYVIVTRSDGETEGDSKSSAVQSKDRRGAHTKRRPITNLDFGEPNSAEIIQRTHFAGRAARIPGRNTQVTPYLHGVSSENMPVLDDGLRLMRHYQPNYEPRRQVDRTYASNLSPLDWELVPYSGYGPSEHHQYWASAGAVPFATQTFGLTCNGTTQGYPRDNIEDPLYPYRMMQPDRTQPLFYQLPEPALVWGKEYYGTNPHQVPHQQIHNCFNDGLINRTNHFEQEDDTYEQTPGGSEIYIEEDMFIDEHSANNRDGRYECESI